jgi:polysaccharide export outer membrane protein
MRNFQRELIFFAILFSARGLVAQQNSPSVLSNVEETQSTASSRRSTLGLQGNGPLALPDDFSKLVIEPAFVLQFDVYGIPELSHDLSVDGAGDVQVPLAGNVQVAGLTLRQAEDRIDAVFVAKDLIKAPQVNLHIAAFAKQSVTVSGEVQGPGKIEVLMPRTLLDVLALAGGETTAAGGQVEIHHRSSDIGPERVEVVSYVSGKDSAHAQTATVYPGDSVYVPRAGVVYVLGAVTRPGGYLMVSGGTLTIPQAIALALGTNQVASVKDAVVVHKTGDTVTRYIVPLKTQQDGKSEITQLADGDMLYVPTSRVKAILVNTQSVLASAASSGIYAAANH